MISEYSDGALCAIHGNMEKAESETSAKVREIFTGIELSVNDAVALLKGVNVITSPEDAISKIDEALRILQELSLKVY